MANASDPVTVSALAARKHTVPIVMITAYDAWMARLVDPHVDCILVGDSMGYTIQGRPDSLRVTIDEMVYHTRLVTRGATHALVVADLPHATYQGAEDRTVGAARRCLEEGRAHAVKIEGGASVLSHVEAMVAAGMPVVGHLGPPDAGAATVEGQPVERAAAALEAAGAFMIVLVGIDDEAARAATGRVAVPTVGIGSGPACDGQVRIFHDLLGLAPPRRAGLAAPYCDAGDMLRDAIDRFACDVRARHL